MLQLHLQTHLQPQLSPQQIKIMKLIQLTYSAFEYRIYQEFEENTALEFISFFFSNNNITSFNIYSNFFLKYEFNFLSHLKSNKIFYKDFANDRYTSQYYFKKNYYSPFNNSYYLNYEEANKQLVLYNKKSLNSEHLYFDLIYSLYNNFTLYLQYQIETCNLNINNYIISNFIIGIIDINGYIIKTISQIKDKIHFFTGTQLSIKRIDFVLLNFIHKLDPCGVGSRNLKECLIIQINNKINSLPLSNIFNLAKEIINFSFENFYKKKFNKIKENFNISNNELKLAIYNILNFNPKPAILYPNQNVLHNLKYQIPDLLLRIYNGQLELTLNKRKIKKLTISNSYKHLLNSYKKKTFNNFLFLKTKVKSAKDFIDAVKKRDNTLILIMNVILYYQKDYFVSGNENKLRTMTLKDIAYFINMDISTISRVISNKFMVTPYKNLNIKELFSEGISNKYGELISTIVVKNLLNTIINSESKKYPLTDEKITIILKDKGYNVARRTISKYREKFYIPKYRLRKSLYVNK
jgi:RNA polymerase sigma-54 factor